MVNADLHCLLFRNYVQYCPDGGQSCVYSGASMGMLSQMKQGIREALQPPRARTTGALYLLYFLTAILAQTLVSRGLAVPGNIVNIVGAALYLVVTLLFYGLFKPVSRTASLLAALVGAAGCVEMIVGFVYPAFATINLLLFFGPYCLLIGYLILRSSFLPRVLGVLMVLAGLGWLAFMLPGLPHFLSVAIEALGIVAEASLMLWLLVMGVKTERWRQQASAARASARTAEPPSVVAN